MIDESPSSDAGCAMAPQFSSGQIDSGKQSPTVDTSGLRRFAYTGS